MNSLNKLFITKSATLQKIGILRIAQFAFLNNPLLLVSSTLEGSYDNCHRIRSFTNKKKVEKPDDDYSEPIPDAEISRSSQNDHGVNNVDDDPFGIHFDDGADRLGPKLPPKYKRDAMTGKFTGIIEKELSDKERRILESDTVQKDRILMDRIVKAWSGKNGTSIDDKLNQLGKRIRESDMALNVLGRSVKSQASYEKAEDGKHFGRDETGFTQHLTSSEFQAYQKYMKDEHSIANINEDDIPVIEQSSSGVGNKSSQEGSDDADELELSLKWLTARAQREMDDVVDDNPYSDMMPGDLNPSKLVNRKRAKPIPVQLLHHNNVQLLHQFLTPTGQIQNRIQTRLGAREQRRVAKLIRRARAIGLLPYMGQSKIEQVGWIHASDINEMRDWEKELMERGLTIDRSARKPEKEE